MPLDGIVSMLMGERRVDVGPGELLIVENMKLHRILDIPGLNTRVSVISFMSNFVYSLGSPSHDYFFLLPFYTNVGNRLHIVRDVAVASEITASSRACLSATSIGRTYFQIGCKAYFLELLYILAEFFRAADFRYSELIRQQERSAKLKPVLEFVDQHFAERIALKEAAVLGEDERPTIHQVVQEGRRHDVCQLRDSRSPVPRGALVEGESADHRGGGERGCGSPRSELFRSSFQRSFPANAAGICATGVASSGVTESFLVSS